MRRVASRDTRGDGSFAMFATAVWTSAVGVALEPRLDYVLLTSNSLFSN